MTFRVCLDPGHGGPDKGTHRWGLTESEYVFGICEEVAALIDTYEGMSWCFTRNIEHDPTFRERAAVSESCDFVLSVHVNANQNTDFHAWESYHLKGDSVGRQVAQVLSREAPEPLHSTGRGGRVKLAWNDPADPSDDWLQHPQNVLQQHGPPSVLAELGFASNALDREFLLSRWGRIACVSTLVKGLLYAAEITAG